MIRSKLKFGRTGRKAASWLLLLLALSLSPSAAFAHAKLIRSQPKAKSSLEQAPKLVELWFNEELEPGFSTIEVKNEQGRRVDRGEVTLSEGGKKAQVELEDLEAGKYSVVWKVLSKDEHTIRGRFTFTVTAADVSATPESSPSPAQQAGVQGADQPVEPGPQGTMTPTAEESAGESSISWADNIVRWLSYLAMMTLFGGFAFHSLVMQPALRQSQTEDLLAKGDPISVSARRTVGLFWISITLLTLMSLLALVFQASAVFDKPLGEALSPALLGQVITRTGFGRAWLLQILATAVLLLVVFYLARRVKQGVSGSHNELWWFGLLASAVLFLAPSLTGHAAASAEQYRLATLADWLHLVASGFWVGGLFHLALTLPPALHLIDESQRMRVLSRVISLFTRVAIPSVGVVALAGLYNTWLHVGSLRSLWGTPYGRTLLFKLGFVLLMLLLGGVNNYHFGRRTARLAEAGGSATSLEEAKLERGFSRSVALEAGLGVLVLLVTAMLVFLTPAMEHPVMTERSQSTVIQSGR